MIGAQVFLLRDQRVSIRRNVMKVGLGSSLFVQMIIANETAEKGASIQRSSDGHPLHEAQNWLDWPKSKMKRVRVGGPMSEFHPYISYLGSHILATGSSAPRG